MLNTEMQKFFEDILAARKDTYRFTPEDLAGADAFTNKQDRIRLKVLEILKMRAIEEVSGMKRFDEAGHVLPLPAPEVTVDYSEQKDGYVREHWTMETLPGIHMPLFVLIPDAVKNAPAGSAEKHTYMLAAHGHGPGKDSVTANMKLPIWGAPRRGGAYAEIMAQNGYITFAPDMWGFGERRMNDMKPYGTSDCTALSDAAEACGFTLLGLFIWDHMRVVDYMLAQDDCAKVAMIGFSGGGEQTIFTAAMDERIAAGYAGGYLHQYKGGMLYNHMCSCNFVPELFRTMELWDAAGLIVPRPMLYENGTTDSLDGIGGIVNVEEAADHLQAMYDACGVSGNLDTNFFEGGHMYKGDKTLSFFEKHLA